MWRAGPRMRMWRAVVVVFLRGLVSKQIAAIAYRRDR